MEGRRERQVPSLNLRSVSSSPGIPGGKEEQRGGRTHFPRIWINADEVKGSYLSLLQELNSSMSPAAPNTALQSPL